MSRSWLVLAPLLLIALFAVTLSFRAPRPSSPLNGTWVAKGTVTGDSDAGTLQPVGTRIRRRWVFSERCTDEQCQLWLTREAAGGRMEAAPVRRVRGKLHAVFRKSAPSCGADPGGVTRFFDIMVAPGDRTLTATEDTTSTSPGCAPLGQSDRSTSSVRWTARRVGA